MRGFIQQVRSVALSAFQTGEQIAADCQQWLGCHFDFFHEGWMPRGLFLRMPGTRLSTFLEWQDVQMGRDIVRSDRGIEVFLGRFRAVFCLEPKAIAHGAA
jgi:hypothetical protein